VLIDWFTVVVQIINFLILVALLKHFLYGRILHAMDERERTIASQFIEAEAKTREAEQTAESHRQKLLDFEGRRDDLFTQAKEEAGLTRKEYLEEARREVGEIRLKWRESIEQEKTVFLKDLRQRATTQVYHIARRALKDLANKSLEQHLAEVFIEQIQNTDERQWESISESIREGSNTLIVHTAFELPPSIQHRIIQALQDRLKAPIPIVFEPTPDTIGGIALKTPGYTIGWSFDQYLDALEEHLSKALEEEPLEIERATFSTKDQGEKR